MHSDVVVDRVDLGGVPAHARQRDDDHVERVEPRGPATENVKPDGRGDDQHGQRREGLQESAAQLHGRR